MFGKSDSSDVDPFLRIIDIVTAQYDHLLNAIESTCTDRAAWSLASADESFSTYFLEGGGAEEATQAFQAFLERLPPPNTTKEFDEAVQHARKFAAAAGSKFEDVKLLFEMIQTDHDWARNMKVIPRAEFTRSFAGWELTRFATLYMVCDLKKIQSKFWSKQLKAYSDYAIGAGLLSGENAKNRLQGGKKVSQKGAKRKPLTRAEERAVELWSRRDPKEIPDYTALSKYLKKDGITIAPSEIRAALDRVGHRNARAKKGTLSKKRKTN